MHHVTRRADAALDDHLKYLADLAADRLVQSFQLVRTVTWAVPIMGFLGTVIGITMAIANVTPEQLDSSLPEVTSGLAVAFDTTAQAL
ncbi:MAG: MotA/TolQ/ExbB proton channel family protein, partial [bacterium]